MSERIWIIIDGTQIAARSDMTAAAALALAGASAARRSRLGELRAPLCGMGVCQECRVEIDGLAHRLACQTLCQDGMQIRTHSAHV